jgi:hypothetical protein
MWHLLIPGQSSDLVRNELPRMRMSRKFTKQTHPNSLSFDIAFPRKQKMSALCAIGQRTIKQLLFSVFPDWVRWLLQAAGCAKFRSYSIRKKVQKYELSTEKILNLLRAENIEFPVGRISDTKKEYSVRLLAKFKDASEIGDYYYR